MRLAAGLSPDPLRELQRSPRPPSRNWGEGCLLITGREGKEWEKGRKGMGRGKGGREQDGGKGRGGREGEGRLAFHTFLGPDDVSSAVTIYMNMLIASSGRS